MRVGENVSDWMSVHGGMPQGARLGPIVFLFMVNNLLADQRRVKFVTDTVTWEHRHVPSHNSHLQDVATDVAAWSERTMMQLTVDKTKENKISFSRKRISCAKVLGVIISPGMHM